MKKWITIWVFLFLIADNQLFANDTTQPKARSTITGTASYYSKKFEGRKTATGEHFHHKNLTGASNNFKLNTWVKVTNIKTGAFVVVRINDRMHRNMKKKGRVIDLTRSAAAKIGILSKGLAKVRVELAEKPSQTSN
ncbi:MAG TPA: septal ring lytic transglycosylase RlpA family lipoprotein [Chitinophagaceae bacterium]|nr:septal ring lytic transglycosylase RlpA family lipoprotein [Chitinophagaceae bacterium]HCT22989.1 septal ring lytic transglycosylase RlpA family lipoprotein [Chitinophagaceae bacterium]